MTVPGGRTAAFGGAHDAERDDEVLAQTERSRVCRHFLPGGSIICKQLLGANTVRRARRETAILERLASVPGVVKRSSATHDADSIALEDVIGVPLSEVLLGERLGIATLLDLALELTETVAAMHRLGVVHRDINPSNILLAGQQRRPVLIDFGIASSSAEERPAFTAQAEIEGTLAYIAPEQTGRTGRVMDQRADLYSLGVTLYELTTGHRPFESDDPFQVIRDHLARVAIPPATRQPDVPQVLSDIIMRLLKKEPDQRYQSADGLAADLARLIKGRAEGKTQGFRLGERDFPRRLLAPSRLIGRGAEIAALHAAFDDAVEGRKNCLLVSGSPGVGKTALINELRTIVTAKRGLFVMGKFDRYRQDMEADAVLQALRSLFRLLLAEPEEELVPLRASLLRAVGSGAKHQAAVIPEFGALLKIVPDGVHDGAPANQGRLAQRALEMLKCVASKSRPVVFVADDLQWAPTTPLGLFDAVLGDAGTGGLLLVGAYRKEDVDSAHPLSALLSRWERLSSPPRRLLLQRVRVAAVEERAALLAELDVSHDWLQCRATDAPDNFSYSVRLVEAERAWALADFANASKAFEAALRDVRSRTSPRDRALVAQRAGVFYLEHGLERYGRLLLVDARQFYEEWGAAAKVRELEADYPFVLDSGPAPARTASMTTVVSSDAIDMVGILRASQALSSQTSLKSLQVRVVELLAALTGATAVMLVVRRDDREEWFFSPTGDEEGAPISVTEAGARGLLPLTAFRYVERTRESLLLPDATRDDRFARDPYFTGCEYCSLLVVPILSQGEPRAVLILENRLGRDAFSAGRLDAVLLIAGQLAVTLDNALLYASLEQKVAERTEALAAANKQLALLSLTDALTGLPNRRGLDDALEREWRRAQRTKTSIGFAMIDIDEFKKYNDHYGHLAGDACLRRIARILVDGLRPGSDLVARYGGEEFVLILPGTDCAGIYCAAERLRANVAALREPHATVVLGIVTVSVGVVAVVPSPAQTAAQSLEAADAALYEAKRTGRNRVAQATSTPAA